MDHDVVANLEIIDVLVQLHQALRTSLVVLEVLESAGGVLAAGLELAKLVVVRHREGLDRDRGRVEVVVGDGS